MKTIVLLSLFVLLNIGCATSAPKWQNVLWHAENSTNENPEIGILETEELAFNVIVTEFSEHKVVYNQNYQRVMKKYPTFIAISVMCRNQSHATLDLQANPIQVITPSQMLAKELSLEHVMYKLYGGRMREISQFNRLAELSEPVPSGSTFSSAILAGVVEGIRASERRSIVNEMYEKEVAQYQLYYHSFAPVSLPKGVATSWTQYYPYTLGPIQVMLQGQTVEAGISFRLPRPPPTLSRKKTKNSSSIVASIIVSSCIIGIVSLIMLTTWTKPS